MSVLSSLIFLLVLVSFVTGFNQKRSENDKMCKIKGNILCMKDELMIIATVAKSIAQRSNEIEQNIKQTKVLETLNRYVNIEMNFTHFSLPSSRYHMEFFQHSNIDKQYLSHLFLEAHYAMNYYYDSITDLLNLKGVFAQETDEWFKKIQENIRVEIICRYRSILHLYSQEWPSTSRIGRIQFSRKHRLSPSLMHNVHSVVVARYLREWMDQINNVIINLEMKYF